MRFSDLKLRNRLILGFGIIIILIFGLEFILFSEVGRIADINEKIYRHPFTVSNSVRDIKIEINAMHRWMKDIVLVEKENEIERLSKLVDKCEARSLAKFDTVFNYFLGNMRDVQTAHKVFVEWRDIRDEVILLMKSGLKEEAVAITKGKGMDHINLVITEANKMIEYANLKAEDFKNESREILHSVYRNVIIITITILIFSILIAFIITRSITKPIDKIINRIKQISLDQFGAQISVAGENHLKILDNSVDELEKLSRKLAVEINQRKQAQHDLEDHQKDLESIVEKRTEELYETKQLLSNAFDGAVIGMVIINADGRFYWVNNTFCKIVGYTESELKNCIFNDITHPEDLEIGTENLKKLISKECDKVEYSKRYIHKNGDIIDVQISTSILKDKRSGPNYFFVQIRDITEKKKVDEKIKEYATNLEQMVEERTVEIEEKSKNLKESQKALTYLLEDVNEFRADLEISNRKLEEANKELEAFSYSVSHDLRAPLRAIDGFSRMLEENYSNSLEDEAKRLLDTIRSNTKKMGLLIDDLLAFSRLGRKKITMTKIDMTALVNDTFEELNLLGTKRKIKFDVKDLPPAYGDFSLIRQVVYNLLTNAIKFSQKEPTAIINVGFNSVTNETIYYVRDNGVGFDMEYIHKLFNVFQRLHTDKEFEGTGVGLAIVQRIISRHGGRTWAEAEVGKGAKFYFSLPHLKEV